MQKKATQPTENQFGIGAMTGTSLDGLDLALCRFDSNAYEILEFHCLDFPSALKKSLAHAHLVNGFNYFEIEKRYSQFVATAIRDFQSKTGARATFAGIHGQTVFHQPESDLTVQMLNGALIATKTGIVTVCDFRRGDMANGGQGAPLVPIGDRDLFSDYSACLNLGGFANISLKKNGVHTAFDICPVNIVLNLLAQNEKKEYDDKGQMAASGELDIDLLNQLNSLKFYSQKPPKSLGREWMENQILPLLKGIENRVAMRTFTEHAAEQIASELPKTGKVLMTGGGAYNDFLISSIRKRVSKTEMIIPSKELIEGKEALIFAYLAKLRLDKKINVLSSATGASRDSCAGAVYFP